MIKNKTQSSGTFKLPELLKYPPAYQMDVAVNHLKGRLCYVIRHHNNNGMSVLISRKADTTYVMFGDWNGNKIELDNKQSKNKDSALLFANTHLSNLIEVMQLIRIEQAQFFFSMTDSNFILYDIQVALNKFCGPGMVRDIFGKIFMTQEVLKIEPLDDRAIEYITKGSGTYAGDLLIKPSKFHTFSPAVNITTPLYVEIKR